MELIRKQTVLNMIDNLQFGDCGTATERLTKLYDAVENQPSVDAVEVVRCKDCKHRQVNEHYGEEGYLSLKAMCDMDTGDPFELGRNAWDDDWFCGDGERKTDG